jgi:hypothetical protein
MHTDETTRRFYGEFFTPVKFAKKALDYIEKVVGKNWWSTGEYRLWDMACGTGNLQYHLPIDALQYTYLSTILEDEIEQCKKLFPTATCFQYDYLNEDIDNFFASKGEAEFSLQSKMPARLLDDLNNPKIKWIIFINPPFATSQKAGANSESKKGVSDTKLRNIMHNENLGEDSRELSTQFLFRIKREFEGKQAYLGLFYKLKYINSNNDQKFRDKIFHFTFKKGFMFSSANFSGTSKNSPFPVGFLIWDLNKQKKLEDQNIELNVFTDNMENIGSKIFKAENKETHLSKWIDRPPAKIKFPPLGSAIEVKEKNIDRRDRIANNFLASLMCAGNDMQHQNLVYLLSAPSVSAGALSVTPDNFEKAMVVHAVRRIAKATWVNDRDQFMIPKVELDDEFIIDCAIWNLFSTSNQTASLKNVLYENIVYQVENHFFPYLLKEIKKWKIVDSEIVSSLLNAENRFMATWIQKKNLSEEAKFVLEKGKEIYKFFYSHLNQLNTKHYKIETWDAGWWQIRKSLSDRDMCKQLLDELKSYHNQLKEKLLPQIYEYGFLCNMNN